jgi:hypothetical protein
MDYKHWCKFLEPETLIKWETEIIVGERVGTINRDFDNFSEFINYTLNWSNTKDGHEFWESLCHTPSHQLIDYSQEQERYFYGL